MKKSIVINCFIALAVVIISSCKDNKSFTISGTITNPGSLKKVYLYQADSSGSAGGGLSMVDSTNLSENGKFTFKRQTPYANLYDIKVGENIFDLIAKNGNDIEFSTNLQDSTHTYNATGSEDADKMKEFNRINNVYNKRISKLVNEYRGKSEKLGRASDSLVNVYRPMIMKEVAAQSDEVLKFAEANVNSLVGFYALTGLEPIRYEQQMVAYADKIKDNFKDNPDVQRFVRHMKEIAPLSVGHKAPDFTTSGLDGKPVKLSDYKGKYVLVDFWASWCAPCRQENPNVVKQYNIYKSKGLNILGISLDVDRKQWEQAIKKDGLTWNHASDLKNFNGPTEVLYHIEAIPSNFMIDPQGTIIAKNITGADLEEFLNKTFNKAQL